MSKQISIGNNARTRLLRGALKLAHIVGLTYGPHGRHVLLDRFAGLLPTRDGVTVAREVGFPDPIENMGAEILKQACLAVNDEVGDGTTTAAVLTAAVLQEGHKQIAGGLDPSVLIRELDEARIATVSLLRNLTIECADLSDVKQVALLAGYEEEIAEIIAEGVMAAGEDGTIIVEDGHSTQTKLVLKDGMEIDKGFTEHSLTPSTNPKGSDKVDGPVVAVIGQRLHEAKDVVPILEQASQQRPRPLLLFTAGLEDAAMATVVYNSIMAVRAIPCHPIEAPGVGPEKLEILKDIAALAGAHYVDPAAGDDPRKFKMEYLGSFREARVWPRRSRFIAYGDKIVGIKARINELRHEMEHTESAYKRDRLEQRIAKLAGGLCVIRVGAYTEAEMKEKRSRVEDALHATQAAMAGGIVPGGGIALLRAAAVIAHSDGPGWQVLSRAMTAPFRRLAANAGLDGGVLIKILNRSGGSVGWDFLANEQRSFYTPPRLVDATEVVVAALNCACSVASVLLNTDVAIATGSR